MATDRTVLVRLKANVSDFNRGMMAARGSIRGVTEEIDHTNDRTAWLAQSVLGLGPAFIPLAAGAVPVVAGLATQMGVAALAAGTAALAFNGVGDGLKALNDYQMDPTEAHLKKLDQSLRKIGPAGEEFVLFLDRIGPKFNTLATTSREGLFPGVEDGIRSMVGLLPQLNRIVREVSEGLGQLAADTGAGLAGPKFEAFFNYLETDAKPILMDMGRTLGGFAEGIANLIVAFGPLTAKFSGGFADMAQSFAEWSRSLDDNSSFQNFLQYLDESGPRVANFIESLVHAFAAIVEAAAPVGQILLPAFSSFLDAIATIASTPLGPWFVGLGAAIGLTGRAMALMSVTSGGVLGKVTAMSFANARAAVTFTGLGTAASVAARNMLTAGAASERMAAGSSLAFARMGAQGEAIAGTAGQLALLGVVSTGVAQKVGLSNTAMGALLGSLAGPPGAAIGAAAGALIDLASAGNGSADAIGRINKAIAEGNMEKLGDGLSAAQKQLKDLEDVTGVKDAFGDIGQAINDTFHGNFTPISRVKDKIKEGKDELAKLQHQASEKSWVVDSTGSTHRVAEGFGATAREAAKAAAAIQANRKAAKSVAQQFVGLGESLDDSKVSLDSWIRDMAQAADALSNFASNAVKAARRGLRDGLIRELQAAGPAGALRMKQLADGTDKQIARANAAWVKGQRAIRAYTNAVGGVPSSKTTKIAENGALPARVRIRAMNEEIKRLKSKSVKMDQHGAEIARGKIAALRDAINSLRDRTVTINYHGTRTGAAVGGRTAKADGGQVLATGAQGRGARDDSIEALLSHREFVHNVGAVDYYGERFMNDINQRRFPRPPGYADGGRVGAAPSVSVAAPVVNVSGAQFVVQLDGRDIGFVVDEKMADREDMAGMRGRTGR